MVDRQTVHNPSTARSTRWVGFAGRALRARPAKRLCPPRQQVRRRQGAARDRPPEATRPIQADGSVAVDKGPGA